MTRDRDLMERHVEALYTHDAAGRIVRVREHDGARAPRVFLGRAADGSSVRRYRDDVGDALRRALEAVSADEALAESAADPEGGAPAALARFAAILARFAPVERTEAGPAFAFPDQLPARYAAPSDAVVRVTEANVAILHPLLPDWVPDVHRSPPLMARVVDGRAVAVCGSVRITPRAHEAGVDTAAAWRGRGRRVTHGGAGRAGAQNLPRAGRARGGPVGPRVGRRLTWPLQWTRYAGQGQHTRRLHRRLAPSRPYNGAPELGR